MNGLSVKAGFASWLIILCVNINSEAQVKYTTSDSQAPFQYGISGKLTVGFEFKERRWAPPVYRLCLDAGAAYAIARIISPSYNLEVQLYNGGLASPAYGKLRHRTTIDLINAFTLTGGTDYRLTQGRAGTLPDSRIPLYYFADFVYPALVNPYHFSVSLGTNFVISNDSGKTSQRVGFVNLHQGRFQFSYYNDGGYGIKNIGLGDRYDRYYTGGGLLSYHLDPQKASINLIELGFHKFSGFTENAFNLSNLIGTSFVSYSKDTQQYYNKGCYSLHLANTNTGFGVTIKRENDYALDFQSLIHYVIYNSYHHIPYPATYSIAVDYSNSHDHLNIK
ncbi:toxin 23 [Mucilaginibacter sp. OK268]|uniref:polymorphic toxin type 23 domain-containing protein n=1 Tax=Mucilaginibacter sp. OK268 TaxID=1881048 RepID=UPI00087F7324|nr:polymorphic toxin type 23 domain-containing protein [Mucilaginibacter sp. OK268]SDP60798.1 toxin 23 [Mucilaginibacter sp. OK268]